jgi:hypothetical protein
MHLGFPGRKTCLALFAIAGLVAGALSWGFGQSQNFEVFRAASEALLRGDDLYAKNAADYFKYSPTFALLFVPFTWGPAWLASALWSLLNFAVAGWGIDRVLENEPRIARDPRAKRVALVVALLGIVVATDGDQSNLLVAGAVLLAFVAGEKGQLKAASHLLAASALVKLFPIVLAPLLVLRSRPNGRPRWRALGVLAGALATWAALPLLIAEPTELLAQYGSWRALLARDHGNHGWSVMSLLQDGGLHWSTLGIQLAGLAILCAPMVLALRLRTDVAWRRTLMCSLLCFGVLFNHRAEYATYAISAVAVGVWYATRETKATTLRNVLVLFAVLAPGPFFTRPGEGADGVFAVLSAHRLFHPLRVVPLLVLWLTMQRELLAHFVDVKVTLRRPAVAPVRFGAASEVDHAP